MSKISVLQLKKSPIANAPDYLCKCINKYSNKYCSAVMYSKYDEESEENKLPKDVFIPRLSDENLTNTFDIIHFHNQFFQVEKPSIIQYHSLPYLVNLNFSGLKTVIAQHQSTLPEYRDATKVRNIIDFYSEEYQENYNYEKIRIGFSPSNLLPDICYDGKGYPQTKYILEKLQERNENIEIDIITGATTVECIKRKSLCNILIDECITEGYHRCSLEALALGKLTICSYSDPVARVFMDVSKSSYVPMRNIQLNDLKRELQKIIDSGIEKITEEGKNNRKWMEKHWNPSDIVKEFENIYEKIKKDENN